MGAWIETSEAVWFQPDPALSLPIWERGLKRGSAVSGKGRAGRSLYGSVD